MYYVEDVTYVVYTRMNFLFDTIETGVKNHPCYPYARICLLTVFGKTTRMLYEDYDSYRRTM